MRLLRHLAHGLGRLPSVRHDDEQPAACLPVRLIDISGSTIRIEDVDMVDGTPLLDIKPYVPAFDERSDVRVGWFTGRLHGLAEVRSDDRFREP